MKTSRQQTLPLGEGKSTSSQGDFHANLSQWQESDLERKMTATSGHICCEQYARYSPLGSLARTLLGSSRWYSPARSLKWVVKPLYSMRVTERERNNLTQSKKSAKVLNVRDIQSNRLLFQLVPLVRPIGETEYGLLPTVQTQGLKVNKDGKSIPMNLTLLPTPLSVEVSHNKRITQLKKKGGKTMSSRANGESRPNGLMDYLTFHSLLPTPNAAEGEKWTTKYNPNSQMGKGLTAMACSGLLPTPTAKDGQGGANKLTNGKRCRPSGQKFSAMLRDLAAGKLLPTPTAMDCKTGTPMESKTHNRDTDLKHLVARRAGQTSLLNPLFVCEMMGFPLDWLTLPFQNGEQRALKP